MANAHFGHAPAQLSAAGPCNPYAQDLHRVVCCCRAKKSRKSLKLLM
jgi:hypothetical protein